MKAPQVAYLAALLGMDGVICFRDLTDCAYKAEGEVLKLYAPQSIRRLGGKPGDRTLQGYIGFALRTDVVPPNGPRARIPKPDSLTLCPIANFPWILRHSLFVDGRVVDEFATHLHKLLDAIPQSIEEIEKGLGRDFLTDASLDRMVLLIRFLRNADRD